MTSAADAVAAKTALRSLQSASRRRLNATELAASRAGVLAHVLIRLDIDAAAGRTWRNVFAYEPLATEPGSTELLKTLVDRGARLHVPIMRPDRDLDWRRWPYSPPLGLAAVSTASVILVPALAVDRDGMRLGRGGGSYDRALARVAEDVPIAALLHRGEFLDHVPAQSWDRRVTAVVTPDGWFDVSPPAPPG